MSLRRPKPPPAAYLLTRPPRARYCRKALITAFLSPAWPPDGAANGIGSLFRGVAAAGRKVQTGMVRNYALAFLFGVVGILWFLAVRS